MKTSIQLNVLVYVIEKDEEIEHDINMKLITKRTIRNYFCTN